MARPDPKFDIENLVETGAITSEQGDVVRTATERIAARDLNHRRAWMGHARDILRVKETIKDGHFEGWLRTQPFSRAKIFAYAKAARVLLDHLKASGGPNFGHLPPMNSTVVGELAADDVDPEIRKAYLDRLVKGKPVCLAEVRAALGKVKAEPKVDPVPAPEEEPPKRQPTVEMENLAKGLLAKDRRRILDIARRGELQLLIEAIAWADAATVGFSGRRLKEDEADRLDEKVADALREMPKVSVPGLGEPNNDDDETDLTKKKIVH